MKRYEGRSTSWPSQAVLLTATFSLFPSTRLRVTLWTLNVWLLYMGKKGFFRANIKEPSLMLMPHQMSTGAEYISQLISNLTRVLRVYTAIKIAASHTVSCGFPSAVVCGRIVSRVPFLEHGKLLSQTFDYTAPPLLLCLLSMSYCLHAEMKD